MKKLILLAALAAACAAPAAIARAHGVNGYAKRHAGAGAIFARGGGGGGHSSGGHASGGRASAARVSAPARSTGATGHEVAPARAAPHAATPAPAFSWGWWPFRGSRKSCDPRTDADCKAGDAR